MATRIPDWSQGPIGPGFFMLIAYPLTVPVSVGGVGGAGHGVTTGPSPGERRKDDEDEEMTVIIGMLWRAIND